MTCIITAPPGSYEFQLPDSIDGIEIHKPEDINIIPSEKMETISKECGLPFKLKLDVESFDEYFNFHIQLVFDTDADAVMFKLQWEA